jgi:antitoxin component HigA of HigAB toxin-antitoxin module
MKSNIKAVSELLPWLALGALIGIFGFSLYPNLNVNIRYAGIFLSGVIPLCLYHFALHKQRSSNVGKLHLSDAEIDSVYYFGFVITLLTLIAAVFTFGALGADEFNPKTIGVQFGLGLFVTAYALVGRLHLQVTNQTDLEPEDAYANYVDRVNNLLGRVDLAYADLDNLMKRLIERMRTTLEAEASENSSRVVRQVEDSFSPLLIACQDLASQIGEHGLRAEIEVMRSVVLSANRSFKVFDTRLQTLAEQSQQAAEPLEKLSSALVSCERGSAALAEVLSRLKIDSNLTKSLGDSVEAISVVFHSFGIAVKQLENDFGSKSQQSSDAFIQFNENLVATTRMLTLSMTQLAQAMANSSNTLKTVIQEVAVDASEK